MDETELSRRNEKAKELLAQMNYCLGKCDANKEASTAMLASLKSSNKDLSLALLCIGNLRNLSDDYMQAAQIMRRMCDNLEPALEYLKSQE